MKEGKNKGRAKKTQGRGKETQESAREPHQRESWVKKSKGMSTAAWKTQGRAKENQGRASWLKEEQIKLNKEQVDSREGREFNKEQVDSSFRSKGLQIVTWRVD